MSISHIPFYITWDIYMEFVTSNFPNLVLSDNALFIGFIILNCFAIFCIYLFIKLIKFVVILGKNMIYR